MFFERIAACKWAIDIWTHYILAILCIFHVFFYAALAHATGSNLIWVTLCRRVDKCRQGSSSSTCSSERLKQCTAAGTEECLSAHDTKGSEIDAGPHEAGAGKAKVRIWCSCRPLTKVTKWRHGCQTILQAAEATVWLVTHSWPGWQTKTNKQTETHEHTSIRAAPNRTNHAQNISKNAVQKRIFCNVPSWSKSLKKFGYSETTTCGPIWTGSRVTPSIQLRARPPRIERFSRTVTFRPLLARVTLLQIDSKINNVHKNPNIYIYRINMHFCLNAWTVLGVDMVHIKNYCKHSTG